MSLSPPIAPLRNDQEQSVGLLIIGGVLGWGGQRHHCGVTKSRAWACWSLVMGGVGGSTSEGTMWMVLLVDKWWPVRASRTHAGGDATGGAVQGANKCLARLLAEQ